MRPSAVRDAPAFEARLRLPRAALAAVLAAALLLLLSARAEAYPFMVKHGYSGCSTCHADPSGGELLTPYGRALSSALLSTEWPRGKPAAKRSSPVSAPRAPAPRPVPAPAATGTPAAPPLMTAAEPPPAVSPAAPPPPVEPAPSPVPRETETSGPAPPATSPGGAGAPAVPAAAPPLADGDRERDSTDAAAPPPAAQVAPSTWGESDPSEESTTAEDPAAGAVPGGPPDVTQAKVDHETASAEVAEAATEGSEETEEAAEEGAAEEGAAEEPGPFSKAFFGLLPDSERVLLGGSLRLASLLRPGLDGERARFFPMQVDVYGQVSLVAGFSLAGSLGVAKVPEGSLHARAAQITSNQSDGYNVISRTHYARFDFGEGAHSVRGGRLNLPFGLRISEHVMWVREQTQTDRESDQQHGVALAMNFEALRFEIMGILGNYQVEPDYYRERGYSAYAEYALFEGGAVGLSSLVTTAADDLNSPSNRRTTRQAHGATLRASIGELVLLAEVDLLLRSRRAMGYVGMIQLDFELLRGLHALATGEILDSGGSDGAAAREGAGKPRGGGWLSAQWFFLPHFDLRIDGIARQSEPFQLLTQLHVYL